jgi:Tol biopolymer transport system component
MSKTAVKYLLAPSGLVLALSMFGADAQRPIADIDLYAFQWIANAQISPDGSQVIYTHVRVTPKHDNYETDLWMVPAQGGTARQLTSGPHDSGALWSPDGRRIAFVRVVEKEGKPQPPQIYLLSMDGGEARALTDLPKGAGGAVWSPDGRMLAFSSTNQDKDFDKKKDAPEESDVKVITRAVYRANGAGYPEPGRPAHIWVVDVPGEPGVPQKPRQVTKGEFGEEDYVWSKDGAKLYFTSDRVKEPYYEPPHAELFVVSARGGDITKLAAIDGPIGGLALSPDGSHMAFEGLINHGEGVTHRSYSQTDLFLTAL